MLHDFSVNIPRLYKHNGHLQGNRQQWKLFKNILIISSKLMKFYIQWSKIDQFRDDLTTFGALRFETNYAIYYILLISINFRKLSLSDISEEQKMLSCFFSHPPTPYFMLVIPFIRNCKTILKNVFGTLFLLKTRQKRKIDQNVLRGTN